MIVGISTYYCFYTIGPDGFLYAFFSTIACRLEHNNWGSRFPVIMKRLYNGSVGVEDLDKALRELKQIHEELKRLPPDQIVWDANDRSVAPPWGYDITDKITNLGNYFITSNGEQLFDVLFAAFSKAKELGKKVEIIPLNPDTTIYVSASNGS